MPRPATARRLPSKKVLLAKADRLWAWAVFEDWGYQCAFCGRWAMKKDVTDVLAPHHLISKGRCNRHRHTLRNGMALCHDHHTFNGQVSPHNGAVGFVRWLDDKHPEIAKWIEEHCFDTMDGQTTTQGWYLERIKELRPQMDQEKFEEICGPMLLKHLED